MMAQKHIQQPRLHSKELPSPSSGFPRLHAAHEAGEHAPVFMGQSHVRRAVKMAICTEEQHERMISGFFEKIRGNLTLAIQMQSLQGKGEEHSLTPERLVLTMIELHNDQGLSLAEAAEKAGIEGFSGDNPPLPSMSKARLLLHYVVEERCKRDDPEGLMREFEQLCPYQDSITACDVSMTGQKLADVERNGGYCSKMVSELAGVTLSQDTLDPRAMKGTVARDVSQADYQQNALGHALKALQNGGLSMFNASELQNHGMKLEAYNKRSDTYLVCLHVMSDARIYGEYDPSTGVLTWKGIVDDHRKWGTFIQNYAKR